MSFSKYKVNSIGGDASPRKFYRFSSGKKSKIYIFSQKDKYNNLHAYLAVNRFLRSKKILAPKLYEHNLKKGMICVQDFGDKTYLRILETKKNKLQIYKKIINFLLSMQKIKTKQRIKIIGNKKHLLKKYSINHLLKESNLFFDWYLPLFLNKKKTFKIKKKTNRILYKIYKKLTFANSCFVHRDFHAENLMKVGGKIGLIDTQDAVIGSPVYDLVSLIDDVRIKTSKKLKDKIYNYYLSKGPKIYRIKTHSFCEDFNILSVQRSLKIIGIFSRLCSRDKKNRYLKFIPYTWKILEMRMKSKIFKELKKILDKNIPKKNRKKILNDENINFIS